MMEKDLVDMGRAESVKAGSALSNMYRLNSKAAY